MKKWIETAIEKDDSNSILNEGAELYRKGEYEEAIEYYRLASAMGNKQAMCNLGYSYMYGRSVEKNLQLAFYYFKLSCDECTDSMYKLGNMYESGMFVEKDDDTADYYYNSAIDSIYFGDEEEYPSVYYTVARRLLNAGDNDYRKIYYYLTYARDGYEEAIDKGELYYQQNLDKVLELLEKEEFKEIKEEIEKEDNVTF